MLNIQELENIKVDLINQFSRKYVVNLDAVRNGPIILNNRMRTRAGCASLGSNTITLNNRLLSKDAAWAKKTLVHELSHLLAWAIFKDRGHGKGWRTIMLFFGFPPNRTHNYDVSGLKRRHKAVAKAKCPCKVWDIKSRMHKKMLGGSFYRCAKCNSRLELINE